MLQKHYTFEEYSMMERANRVTIKRRYGKHLGVDAQYYTPVRNKILRFINGKGKVSIKELNSFFKSINVKTGRNTSMNWIYRNRKLVHGVKGKTNAHLFMLTSMGKKILSRTDTYESIDYSISEEGEATLSNTPGMGNSQPPQMGEIGSGDTFDAVGSPGDEECECDPDEECTCGKRKEKE
jgi:hypothetical protein